MPDLSGKPKGESLDSLRRGADGDEVEWLFPAFGDEWEECRVRLSLSFPSGEADPQRTYLIVAHEREPTREQQATLKAKPLPWPEDVETFRQQWLSAIAADDEEQAAALRRQLYDALSLSRDSGRRHSVPGALSGPPKTSDLQAVMARTETLQLKFADGRRVD